MKLNTLNKKKVLFVIDSLGSGGAEKDLATILNHLNNKKYNIDLLTFKKGGLYEELIPKSINRLKVPDYYRFLSGDKHDVDNRVKMKFYIIRAYSAIFSRFYIFLASIFKSMKLHPAQLSWFFNKSNFTSLHKHYDVAVAFTQGLPTYFVTKKVSANSKYTWINTDYKKAGYNPKFDAKFYEIFDKIVNISPKGEEIFLEAHPSQKYKALIVYNIISGGIIKKMSESINSGFSDTFDGTRILTIGRIVHPKGYDLAIKACAILKNKKINLKWYAIGEGPLKSDLEVLIKEEDVQDEFLFIGTYSNPYPFIKECDIYCQPSRFEGFGIALAEARILNKPIVATNFNVVYDQLTNYKNGIITEMNPLSLAEGIEKYIANEVLKKNIIKQLTTESASNESEIAVIEGILDLEK
ncbi:glycosyltransferase involved in cell wall biosynthesis [Mariniflexile fucanivorans]|uniref:Glycosyltransferase involved in cell wall biosynthesis n=1 Tax=Mariniflexile fucanivorans TaxID=264023 RepID=A0A4R1RGB5_9FLAO|nr:glycosyltransferase [Mariniflexile fucanivorans]TCL65011.1 glycosyltransferase involved in cell wall biosynthesis [Mariniflexile fucanivorans]